MVMKARLLCSATLWRIPLILLFYFLFSAFMFVSSVSFALDTPFRVLHHTKNKLPVPLAFAPLHSLFIPSY